MKLTTYFYSLLLCFLFGHMANGQEATDDFSDFPVKVADYKGLEHLFSKENDTTYVINFWATWCSPCVKELPYFEQLHQNREKDKVKVILVSLDFRSQLRSRLLNFLNKKQLKAQVVALCQPDANAWIDKIDPSWSGSIPATLVYNRQKREFYEQEFDHYGDLESIINSFIKNKK